MTTDLKEIYQASTENLALQQLDALEQQWGEQYPQIIKSWRDNWDNVSTLFQYPPDIRKARTDVYKVACHLSSSNSDFTSASLNNEYFCSVICVSASSATFPAFFAISLRFQKIPCFFNRCLFCFVCGVFYQPAQLPLTSLPVSLMASSRQAFITTVFFEQCFLLTLDIFHIAFRFLDVSLLFGKVPLNDQLRWNQVGNEFLLFVNQARGFT